MEQTILLAIQRYMGIPCLVQVSQFLGMIAEHGEVWILFCCFCFVLKRREKWLYWDLLLWWWKLFW